MLEPVYLVIEPVSASKVKSSEDESYVALAVIVLSKFATGIVPTEHSIAKDNIKVISFLFIKDLLIYIS